MRTPAGFTIALLIAGSLFAQNRSGFVNTGGVVRTPGSVVFPGGTSALPGVQRTTGSVVYPGGGTQIGVPAAVGSAPGRLGGNFGRGFNNGSNNGGFNNGGFNNGFGRSGHVGGRGTTVVGVPYPVYVGGYGYGGYYDSSYYGGPAYGGQAPPQQQPNVVVVYPQQQPPVIINQFSPGDSPYGSMAAAPNPNQAPPVQSQTMEPSSTVEAAHYLIAFKDHTIYSAVAYWVDGDTLHYFTDGSTHNQVSVSLIDRELTARLNKDSGVEIKLPAVR